MPSFHHKGGLAWVTTTQRYDWEDLLMRRYLIALPFSLLLAVAGCIMPVSSYPPYAYNPGWWPATPYYGHYPYHGYYPYYGYSYYPYYGSYYRGWW